MPREDWYNMFLLPFGRPLSSVIRQLADPKPFPDETVEACLHRLSLCSIRQPTHPSETMSVNKLIAVLTAIPEFSPIAVNRPADWKALLTEGITICTTYKNATGVDLKHPSLRKPQPPSASAPSTGRPGNSQSTLPLCSHCQKRGHSDKTWWEKFPHLPGTLLLKYFHLGPSTQLQWNRTECGTLSTSPRYKATIHQHDG